MAKAREDVREQALGGQGQDCQEVDIVVGTEGKGKRRCITRLR